MSRWKHLFRGIAYTITRKQWFRTCFHQLMCRPHQSECNFLETYSYSLFITLCENIITLIFFPFRTRYGSGSSQTSQNSGDICRICHCESDPHNPLLTPCYCSGSLKYVHQTCLQQWLTASETNSCELCKFPFIMHTKIKPFNEVLLDTSLIYTESWFSAISNPHFHLL